MSTLFKQHNSGTTEKNKECLNENKRRGTNTHIISTIYSSTNLVHLKKKELHEFKKHCFNKFLNEIKEIC